MRSAALLALMVTVFWTPHLKAGDIVLFTDNNGAASDTVPPAYVVFCSGASCSGGDLYPYTVVSETIPATVYIGDPAGYVSDEIVTTVAPINVAGFTEVQFAFTAGLDLTGALVTCASVGGCDFNYNGSVQDVGLITWGAGVLTPPSGYSTTLEFQSLTGTTVPEPSVPALLSIGLAIVGVLRLAKRCREGY